MKLSRDSGAFLLLLSHVLRCVPCSYSTSWLTSYICYVPTQRESMKEWRDSIFFVRNRILLSFTFHW